MIISTSIGHGVQIYNAVELDLIIHGIIINFWKSTVGIDETIIGSVCELDHADLEFKLLIIFFIAS